MGRGFARQRDKNEPEVVEALRAAGACVQKLDGTGVPDLLVGFGGELFLLEVKNPDAKGGGKYNTGDGCLTDAQTKWWATWKGRAPVIVFSEVDALSAIGACPALSGECAIRRSCTNKCGRKPIPQ